MPVNKLLTTCLGVLLSFEVIASDRFREPAPVNAFRVSFADTITPEDAKVMSLRAADLINVKGRIAVADFSHKDSGFLLKDGFVFCMTIEGVMISHPIRKHLIGQNLSGYNRFGQFLFQEMMDVALSSGEGWVEYKWPYPGTDELRQKQSYVVLNEEGFFCAVAAFK